MQPVVRQHLVVAALLSVCLGMSAGARADDEQHVSGVISGPGTPGTVIVQVGGSPTPLTVVVNDSTKVRRSGMLKSEKLSADVLKPGLRIKADGTYENPSIFVAKRISLSKEDLRTAQAIEGALGPVDQQIAANKQRLMEQEQQIVANDRRIAATNTRISHLDDYAVIKSMTVYFPNGRAVIAPMYRTELEQFAAQAKAAKGVMVQVEGYASAVGPDALNQQLSKRRADAVTAVLQQHGVTPTDLAYPAAMGTTGQVASNRTAAGQAQNRRAVIKLLQNRGVAGQ
jgi:outer membrane protein OmpA-like peptidoglycan-associated protein